tara:strand:+ start:99 stop:452 length:354 start_codon:yes stop_codon:yes gene_type:complete
VHNTIIIPFYFPKKNVHYAQGENMIKRLLLIVTLGVMLQGCYMVPMALLGPAQSGFTTASIMQSGVSTTASIFVKKKTGKSVVQHAYVRAQHAYEKVTKTIINKEILIQAYLPLHIK